MGVRLYNTATARFLSVDPVYGGNANPYDYVYDDPLTRLDLDGRWSCGACNYITRKHLEANACRSLGRGCGWAMRLSDIVRSVASGGHGPENAIRHFMWQAARTLYFGAVAAKRLGDAHEYGERGDGHEIDLHNNDAARITAQGYWFRKRMKAAISRNRLFEALYAQASNMYKYGSLR